MEAVTLPRHAQTGPHQFGEWSLFLELSSRIRFETVKNKVPYQSVFVEQEYGRSDE